jgi:hypothetical protein
VLRGDSQAWPSYSRFKQHRPRASVAWSQGFFGWSFGENLWLLVFFVGENWRKWAAPEFPFGDKTGENWAPVSINRQNFFTQIAKSGEIAN